MTHTSFIKLTTTDDMTILVRYDLIKTVEDIKHEESHLTRITFTDGSVEYVKESPEEFLKFAPNLYIPHIQY